LLSSDHYRPGSVFRQTPLKLARTAAGALSLALPPHSVARLQVADGGRS
jgi:hypothetical protein